MTRLIRRSVLATVLLLLVPAGAFPQTPRAMAAGQGTAPNTPATPQPRKATLGEKARAKSTSPPPTQTVSHIQEGGGRELVKIPLTHIGVFDARYLNARNPPNVLKIPATDLPGRYMELLGESDFRNHARIQETPDALRRRAEGLQSHVKDLEKAIPDLVKSEEQAASDLKAARGTLTPRDIAEERKVKEAAIDAAAAKFTKAHDDLRAAMSEYVKLWSVLVDIGFQNNTAGQKLVVSFKAYVPDELKSGGKTLADVRGDMQQLVNSLATRRHDVGATQGTPVRIGDCKPADGDTTCDATITIEPGGIGVVPVTLLARIGNPDETTSTPISFKVDFFAENSTPAHPTGYFCVVSADDLVEVDSDTSWSTKASVAYEATPHVDKDAILSTTSPYQFSTDQDFPASGVLTFDGNLVAG